MDFKPWLLLFRLTLLLLVFSLTEGTQKGRATESEASSLGPLILLFTLI
jgi:hypothetical protein